MQVTVQTAPKGIFGAAALGSVLLAAADGPYSLPACCCCIMNVS